MISVIIPSYNHAEYLPRAINSVLNQTHRDTEIIVVDDASTDTTSDVVKKLTAPNLKYIRHSQNQGPIAAFWTGLQASTRNCVCELGADDWLPPDSLKIRLDALVNHSAEVVHTGLTIIGVSGTKTYIPPLPNRHLKKFLAGQYRFYGINNATFLYQKQVFAWIGPRLPNPGLSPHEDYEYALKAITNCKVYSLDANTYFYEKHEKSHSATYGTSPQSQQRLMQLEKDYLKLLK